MKRMEKTRAFLTEFIIVVLFFTISAIIVVRLFVAANKNSADSILITDCYIKSECIIEEMKASVYGGEEIRECMEKNGYKKTDVSSEHYCRFMDKNLNECKEENADVISIVDVIRKKTQNGELYDIVVVFEKSDETISELSVKIYESGAN